MCNQWWLHQQRATLSRFRTAYLRFHREANRPNRDSMWRSRKKIRAYGSQRCAQEAKTVSTSLLAQRRLVLPSFVEQLKTRSLRFSSSIFSPPNLITPSWWSHVVHPGGSSLVSRLVFQFWHKRPSRKELKIEVAEFQKCLSLRTSDLPFFLVVCRLLTWLVFCLCVCAFRGVWV